MEEIDPRLIEALKETCGGECVLNPGTCRCFGVMPKEARDEINMTENEAEEEAFYNSWECAWYDRVSSEAGNEFKEDKGVIENFLGDDFSIEEKDNFVEIFRQSGLLIENYLPKLVFESAYRAMRKVKNTPVKQYIYLLHTEHSVKIGASNNPERRTSTLGTQIAFPVLKTDIFEVEDQFKAEAELHGKFKNVRLNGEWFKLTEDHVKEIHNLLGQTYVPNQKKLEGK